jgi:phospholipid transport system substrate-binding protein
MRLFLILGMCVSLLWGFGSTQAGAGEPTSAVKAVLDQAMEIQTRADLSGEAKRAERVRLIRRLIVDNFAFAEMARETIKDRWDHISPGQRSEFQNLFSELFQDSYTRMVLNFLQQENIDYPGERAESSGTLVRTVIVRANEHIPVDYHMAHRGGRALIRDVDIDGVSIVENYRDTFRNVIVSSSFDGLLKKMRLQSRAIKDKGSMRDK